VPTPTPPVSAVRRGELALTIGLFVAIIAAVAPLLRVVQMGAWFWLVVLMSAGLLTVGYVARRLRAPAVAVTLLATAVWVGAVTALFFPATAVLWVIPSPEVFEEIPLMIQITSNEILLGVAPLEAARPLTFIIVASMGVLTIALDHVVMTARMPLLATVALIAVWLIPALAVPSGVNLLAFGFLSAAMLYVIRAETRTREDPRPGRRTGGVTAVAAAIGVAAIVAAVVGAPSLPAPLVIAGGSGTGTTIDPTLNLGQDLRRPQETTVLYLRSDAPRLPYLRATTLSLFDGQEWKPDRVRSVPLDDEAFGPVVADADIRVTEYRTTVDIVDLASAWLPVSFPAVAVDGLDGLWRVMPYNRTVNSPQNSAQGQLYEVVTHVPRPTAEQIRATSATTNGMRIETVEVPESTPAIVSELANEVTEGATTDYDRLIALQSWFRGASFTYSLQAPVAEGFDGTGVEAIAQFLEVREGYCVHYAAAFALMARTLDMPSRIVVGFLPGDYTGESIDGEPVAEVTTSQLHAWPEVHFAGIGWVGFEPTKSLGTETRFLPASSTPSGEDEPNVNTPAPTASPGASPTAGPNGPEMDRDDGAASPLAPRLVDLRPYLATVGTLLVMAAVPFFVRRVRMLLLQRRARDGSVASAWRIVQDVAIDLGIAVPGAESPRAFGARLVSRHAAPAGPMDRLVSAIERVSYAPGAGGATAQGTTLAQDAVALHAALLDTAPQRARTLARLFPRSLVIRPGSAFADRRPAADAAAAAPA